MTTQGPSRATSLLLNLAHAIDHMFLLIFATAVSSIAVEFGFTRWEDLMPYSVGAAALFGFASLPAGRLGDFWGRRNMMLVFYFGMGASALLAATVQNAWQMAAALTVLGAFSAIYHPVGIPMLVQHSKNPGLTIGFNGLIGNLGIALSAVVTGLLVKYFGWRMAFVVPGLFSIAAGVAFAMVAPHESEPPAKRTTKAATLPRAQMLRVIAVMIATAITSAIVFNTTTNGNQQLLTERLRGVVEDPALLGTLLSPGVRGGGVLAGRRRPRHRPLPAEAHLPHRGGHAGAVLRAGGDLRRLGDDAAAGRLHGVGVRRHSLHRRHAGALRGRPHALARVGHAPHHLVRFQFSGGVDARPGGEGGRLSDSAAGAGRGGCSDGDHRDDAAGRPAARADCIAELIASAGRSYSIDA
jgi:hypothetical protein